MKIICIGRNFHGHISEMQQEKPREPLFFMKPETALIRAGLPFFLPDHSSEIHYEIELVLRICRLGKHIQKRFASSYYDAVAAGIDFTARDVQRECIKAGDPWEKAKAFDGSAAVSGFVPFSGIKDPGNLEFHLEKNGKRVQKGSSAEMIFSFDELISHISKYVTLKIGDLVFTGTPEGVGPVAEDDLLDLYLEKRKVLSVRVK